jgi:hypothetical protein
MVKTDWETKTRLFTTQICSASNEYAMLVLINETHRV